MSSATAPARTAVVTGASSGIGAATARQLAAAGYHVVLTARRKDRIEALAEELTAAGHSASAHAVDVTDRAAVDALAASLDRFPTLTVLVNNAGGALGADPVATGDPADWRTMYEVNVLGTLHMTQALLPALVASGDGTVVVVSSTAGHSAYEGGAGYVAAKNGARVLAETLRLEIVGQPVRVIEIAPGMVKTEEFAKTRFAATRRRPARSTREWPSRSRPTTSPTPSPGPSPGPPRQHRPAGGPPARPGLQHQGPPRAVGPVRAAGRPNSDESGRLQVRHQGRGLQARAFAASRARFRSAPSVGVKCSSTMSPARSRGSRAARRPTS